MPLVPSTARLTQEPGSEYLHVAIKFIDVTMLAITGGKERTEEEYGRLLAKAGLRLDQVLPTKAPISVLEASPV